MFECNEYVQDGRSCEERYNQCLDISLKESYAKSTEKLKEVQTKLSTIEPVKEEVKEVKQEAVAEEEVAEAEDESYEYYDDRK